RAQPSMLATPGIWIKARWSPTSNPGIQEGTKMYYLQFLLSNLGRKKARTILTLLSVAIAFLLFGLLRSLAVTFDQGAEIAGEDRLVSVNKISLIQPIPESYLARVQALEGVDKATSSNWFGGYYQNPKNQFSQFPVVAEDYFAIYSEAI